MIETWIVARENVNHLNDVHWHMLLGVKCWQFFYVIICNFFIATLLGSFCMRPQRVSWLKYGDDEKQTTSWLTYKVQKWHTLPSGFDKQLRNSLTTLRNNLPRKQQQLRNSSTRPQQLRNSSSTRPPTPDVRCSRRRQNFVSHEAESFAQRECDVITARPIESPKNPQSFR